MSSPITLISSSITDFDLVNLFVTLFFFKTFFPTTDTCFFFSISASDKISVDTMLIFARLDVEDNNCDVGVVGEVKDCRFDGLVEGFDALVDGFVDAASEICVALETFVFFGATTFSQQLEVFSVTFF